MSKKISYSSSGVDVNVGDALVDWLQETANEGESSATNTVEADLSPRPGQDALKLHTQALKNQVIDGIGGFASLFRFHFPQLKKPVLITCTDGVGTKVKLAARFGSYREVAQDCVAMCVNDLICTGGFPILFLDYYATGKLELNAAKEFLTGMRDACQRSGCLLVGGETAEMPGVYQGKDFDCAGFAVGVVDEDEILGAHRVRHGDRLLGISSSGFHSNGFSLLRKVFESEIESASELWARKLLQPTALYVELMHELKIQKIEIHAAAHITGGGMENVPRVLPDGLVWKSKEWEWPAEYREVQQRTEMTDAEMTKTLNCGIGFVLVLPQQEVGKVEAIARKLSFRVYDLGSMEKDVQS